MSDPIKPEICQKIYHLLIRNPGLQMRTIADILCLEVSLVEQHLNYLEDQGDIFSQRERGYTRYYTKKRKRGTREKRTLEIHTKIFALIEKSPGLHLSKIADELRMSAQLAEYHLTQLEKQGLIWGIKKEGGYYRRYYIKNGRVGIHDKQVVALMRQEHLLRIVLLITKNPGIHHKDLADLLHIHPSTLTHHMNRLNDSGVIEVTTFGKEKGYRVTNKKEIMRIMRRYVLDIITSRFQSIWDELEIR